MFGLKRSEPSVASAPQTAATQIFDPSKDGQFQQAVKLRSSGQLAKAEIAFDRIAQTAHEEGNHSKEARALLAKAGVQLRQFAYRNADSTYHQLLKLAADLPEEHLEGAVFVNLAEIHIQLGELPAAEQEAESAVKQLRHSSRPANLIRAELQLGTICSDMGQEHRAKQAYQQAIDLAAAINDPRTEAFAWLILGQTFWKAGELRRAENAYIRAYRLALMQHDPIVATVRAKLAELELSKGNPAEGLRRLDGVLAQSSPSQLGLSEYQIWLLRAQMLAALSRNAEALQMYRKAVAEATRWRQEALPGEVANAASVQAIHKVFAQASDFIAGLAIKNHSSAYAREALEILATNRAADLREARTLAWHRDGRLPPRYYQLLSLLRSEEANSILTENSSDDNETVIRRTRADLSLLETQLAMESEKSVGHGEIFGSRKTLVDIQHALSDGDALFSFNLGKSRSWLWAVTRHTLNLYELDAAKALERRSATWASDIHAGRDASHTGSLLARALFAQVPGTILRKRNWLVVNDGTLFVNVPLAALPDPSGVECMNQTQDCVSAPLVAGHTVRFLSSEFSLSTNPAPPHRKFLFAGIGDPVYNIADARYHGTRSLNFSRVSYGTTTPLARLVGSGEEVRQSAVLFANAELLTGEAARAESLQKLLEAHPTVIHLAVHVLSRPEHPEEAALALSLGKDRVPELLTSELIATYRVPGSLVVMSGCDSEQGKAVPGVGVMGLSRAWLLAGASAVVASTWPMPDEDGRFFRSFYEHFKSNSNSSASVPELAASALAAAQNEMRTANGFRHDPAFWAAYSVISKE
ncbi:MAG TPA: CHAT domain-containing protein [Bryobacteraceae bacterium]|nr:CHAT domain-containing protein [Bryobacteraceae bacterium]